MMKSSHFLSGDGVARCQKVDDAMRDDSAYAVFLSGYRGVEGVNFPGRHRWRKACWSWDKKGKKKAEKSEAGTRQPPCSLPLSSAVRSSPQFHSSNPPSVSGVVCFLHLSLVITITPSILPLLVFHCILSTSDIRLMQMAVDLQRWGKVLTAVWWGLRYYFLNLLVVRESCPCVSDRVFCSEIWHHANMLWHLLSSVSSLGHLMSNFSRV